jgi:hypothetical protein
MVGILFWNLHQNQTACELLAQATAEHSANVIVTAECPISNANVAGMLSQETGSLFHAYSGTTNKRIAVFTRDPIQCGAKTWDMSYIYVRELLIPGQPALLLGGIHNISLSNNTSLTSVQEEATFAANYIRLAEKDADHKRTIVIGDFNLPPFNEAMVKAAGFHAVMDRRVVADREKRIRFQDYPLFYNPMWGFMGDIADNPPGTYYFHQADHLNYYWNVFDQVLLRPDLLPMFRPTDVRVLHRIGMKSLLDFDGRPNAALASDHLPIFIRLGNT